jgi:hypothetical protein
MNAHLNQLLDAIAELELSRIEITAEGGPEKIVAEQLADIDRLIGIALDQIERAIA